MIAHNYHGWIGEKIRMDETSPIIGVVTGIEDCSGRIWLTIDENYQAPASDYEMIIALCYGFNFLRPKRRAS